MRKHRQRAKEGIRVVVKMDFKNNSHEVKRKKTHNNKSLSRANMKVKTLGIKVKILGLSNATLRKRSTAINR